MAVYNIRQWGHGEGIRTLSQLAFLGLGNMGFPMAQRLIEAGHQLTVWNRTHAKVDALVEMGAKASSTPAEAVAGTEATITMLSTPAALEEVLFGKEGACISLNEGQLLIEMSTVGVDMIHSLASRLPDGVKVIDAPVRGSIPQAKEGSLTMLVGTDEETFSRVSRLLEPLGTSLHAGPQGSGAAMKLVVNLTLTGALTLLGEALLLGRSLGLDQNVTFDVLEASPIAPIAKGKRAKIESSSYSPTFSLDLALKDLGLVKAVVENAGLDLKVADACRTWLEEAHRAGRGEQDFTAVVAAILDQKDGFGTA